MPKGIYNHKPHTEERKEKISKALIGKKFSEEHLKKIRERQKGETHSRFKGNKANQNVLHRWIERRKPKPEVCEKCGKKKKLNLASLTNHNYTRNPEDYDWLCYSCHKKMDVCCSQCGRQDIKMKLVCLDCIDWKNRFIKRLKENYSYRILKIERRMLISGETSKEKMLLEELKEKFKEEIDKLAGSKLTQ